MFSIPNVPARLLGKSYFKFYLFKQFLKGPKYFESENNFHFQRKPKNVFDFMFLSFGR